MQNKQFCSKLHFVLYLILTTGLSACAQTEMTTRAKPVVDESAASQADDEAVEADVILLRMARFLSGAQRFKVELHSSYDVVQESGQKIEFEEKRSVTISRPDGLRVEVEHSDGEKHFVFYDGKDITVFNPPENVYAQTAKPGGIDEAIMYFLRDLHMRLPLAVMLVSRFPEEIESRTLTLDYIEYTEIHGIPVHHLAGTTETVDYQVWIAQGAKPLPVRVVLTYKNAVGQPQFRANFSEWNLTPEIQDSLFAFSPPEGARKIAFLAEISNIVPQTTDVAEPVGENK